MMAGMMKLLVVVVGLLFLVPDTTQLSIDHPLYTVVERLNVKAGSFLGLIVSSSRYETALINSTDFEADTYFPYISIAGRTFNFGKFKGEPVIYVLAGEPLANVGVTVQILIDTFRIKGIINFGSAATVSNQVLISDVVIPSQVAFTGVVRWETYESEVKFPSLKIGEYNVPEAGANSLEHITSLKTRATSTSKRTYFFDVHPEWWQQLNSQRLNFGQRPVVHLGEGIRVGSSDIYVKNVAYATFLNKKLNVTAVDTESAAVVATAVANGVPHIVIKGTSNRPGTESDSRLSEVTAKNVLKTVSVFIGSLLPKTNANVY